MSFGRTRIFHLLYLGTALALGCLLVACLDIPNAPDSSNRIESINVHVYQYDSVDSTYLKIDPADSATLAAIVTPKSLERDLEFYWYSSEDKLLREGQFYPVLPGNSVIPCKLTVVDKENNSKSVSFTTFSNSAPTLGDVTIPTEGDSINAAKDSPILFQWTSHDSRDDKLTHVLQIDSISYNVGDFTKVYQSGFDAGKHTFRVIVTDSYGVSDTTSWVNFWIVNSQEATE